MRLADAARADTATGREAVPRRRKVGAIIECAAVMVTTMIRRYEGELLNRLPMYLTGVLLRIVDTESRYRGLEEQEGMAGACVEKRAVFLPECRTEISGRLKLTPH